VDIAFAELCRGGETVAILDKADFEWLSRPPFAIYELICNGRIDFKNLKGPVAFECLEKSPSVQFKNLEEVVSHRVTFTLLPYDVRLEFAKITDITDMLQLTITVKNSDVRCKEDQGIQHAPVQIFGRLTLPTGRIAQTFEGLMDEPVSSCSIGNRTYIQAIPMLTGRYTLNLALKDINGDRLGTHNQTVIVP
jgi:hypothetical protein